MSSTEELARVLSAVHQQQHEELARSQATAVMYRELLESNGIDVPEDPRSEEALAFLRGKMRQRAAAHPELDHGPGLIVIPCGDLGRFMEFTRSISRLLPPAGSRASWCKMSSVVGALNLAIQDGLREDTEWVWITGDDHTFEPDIVHRLLDCEKDIVVPLVFRRGPIHPVLYRDDGERAQPLFNNEIYPAFEPYMQTELQRGLMQVDAAGSAGMLIRRKVLDDLGYPWFTSSSGHYLNEDVLFCKRVRELGYEVWCNTEAVMGHIGVCNILPVWQGDELQTGLQIGDEMIILRREA